MGDKDITNRLDKTKTIKDTPIDKSKATYKFFKCYNPKERKNLANITLEQGHIKDNGYKPSTKEYITKERQIMTLFIPKITIYVQNETKKIIEIKKPDHKNINTIKHRKLQIWKLLDIRIIPYTTNEHKKGNIKESEIHKEWKIKKLTKRTIISCKARKLKKLIILNYTERGKRQQLYKHYYITFILYTVNTYSAFLYINLFISVILTKIVQYITYFTVTIYISLQENLIP